MYREHVSQIRDYVDATGAAGLTRVCTLALLSIRQPFISVPRAMADVLAKDGDSRFLWGFKARGYAAARDNAGDLWRELEGNHANPISAVEAICDAVYGLGPIKAGFVAQMLGYNVACFDSRNMAVLGFLPSDRPWALRKKARPETKRALIARYVRATQELGAEWWWNDWCKRQGERYIVAADTVSRWHVDCVVRGGLPPAPRPWTAEEWNDHYKAKWQQDGAISP